jgi:hypothetical protein
VNWVLDAAIRLNAGGSEDVIGANETQSHPQVLRLRKIFSKGVAPFGQIAMSKHPRRRSCFDHPSSHDLVTASRRTTWLVLRHVACMR